VRRYARGIALETRDGRVVALTISAAGWSATRGGLAVGAPARTVRASLPGARRIGRSQDRRARLTLANGRAADVTVAVRDGRVRRIEVRAAFRRARA
jgi:hypothetical protein